MPAYFTILRPANAVMSAIAVYVGAVVTGATFVPQMPTLIGMLVVFLISGGGMVVNDIKDAEIDKINKPKRPIPSGKISKKAAGIYAVLLFVVGNFLALYYLNELALYVSVFASLLLIAYAVLLKRVIMAGHISVSLLVALTFIYGGVIVGDYSKLFVLAGLAFLANMGREIYKTIDDVMGDKSQNVRTLALKYGVLKTKIIAHIFIIAAVVISFVPYFTGVFNEIYLFFVVISDIVFVMAVVMPVKHSSKLTKIAMMVALVAFLSGAYAVRM